MSDLAAPIWISNGIYVKNQGWFIFGGDGSNDPQAQKLDSLNGQWMFGPNLYVYDHGHCYFQVKKLCIYFNFTA